jgi:hypothetical protein
MQFTFTDDTGCDVATLFARDIELLQANDVLRGGNGELPPSSGISEAFMANGELEYYVTRTLEFNMLEHETMQPMVDHWDAIDCHLNPGEEVPRQNARLLGPWLRNKLYTYTIPDSLFRTWIYNERPRGPLLQATPDEVRINLASIDADDINLFPEFDLRYPAGVP